MDSKPLRSLTLLDVLPLQEVIRPAVHTFVLVAYWSSRKSNVNLWSAMCYGKK